MLWVPIDKPWELRPPVVQGLEKALGIANLEIAQLIGLPGPGR